MIDDDSRNFRSNALILKFFSSFLRIQHDIESKKLSTNALIFVVGPYLLF